jgi:hypothetical protein
MPFAAFVRSDLFDATRFFAADPDFCPDPDPILYPAYYVVVEGPKGHRWGHEVSFHRFSGHGEDPEAQAEALATRVRAHLAAGGRLDQDRWVKIDPAYGSAAYDPRADRNREIEEARVAGEISNAEADRLMAS